MYVRDSSARFARESKYTFSKKYGVYLMMNGLISSCVVIRILYWWFSAHGFAVVSHCSMYVYKHLLLASATIRTHVPFPLEMSRGCDFLYTYHFFIAVLKSSGNWFDMHQSFTAHFYLRKIWKNVVGYASIYFILFGENRIIKIKWRAAISRRKPQSINYISSECLQ